jgi:hypothetical protein
MFGHQTQKRRGNPPQLSSPQASLLAAVFAEAGYGKLSLYSLHVLPAEGRGIVVLRSHATSLISLPRLQ